MAPELPGFYYDQEKKKYFKIVNGTSNEHTSRYHNSVVQSEKRKADYERATKGYSLSRPKGKMGRTQKQEDVKLKNALVNHNRRLIDIIRLNKVDLVGLKLNPHLRSFDAAILGAGSVLELVECKTDAKFARCTNLAVYSSKQDPEPVLISEFGMEQIDAQEADGTVIPMACVSGINLTNFVRTLGDDTLVECYTSATSCVSKGNSTLVLRVSTAYVPSVLHGPRSFIIGDVFNIDCHNPRWQSDFTRDLGYLGRKRRHLFGSDMIANLSEGRSTQYNGIPIQFQIPEEDNGHSIRFHMQEESQTELKSHVTSSHLDDMVLFLGTSIGEIYVATINSFADTFLEGPELVSYILKLFSEAVSAICSVDSIYKYLVSDIAGDICIMDESRHVLSRTVYVSHGSKVTNFFPFENHFVAVGLQAISAYDYLGNVIHKVEYFNNNITNQISIKFGSNEDQEGFILVNESNNELRLIHLETFRSRVLKLLERPSIGHKLKNMIFLEGSNVLQTYFEHNGNGYCKVYKFK